MIVTGSIKTIIRIECEGVDFAIKYEIIYTHLLLPNFSLSFWAKSFSSSVRMVSSNLANTGWGKYQRILEVNPLALLVSWITGSAACGWVNPIKENDVRAILKFAFPVTMNIKWKIIYKNILIHYF